MHRAIEVAEDLVPVGEMKQRLSAVLKRMEQTGRPVIITRNGKAAGVMVTPAEYDALVYRERLVNQVRESMAAADAGQLVDADVVFERLLARRSR